MLKFTNWNLLSWHMWAISLVTPNVGKGEWTTTIPSPGNSPGDLDNIGHPWRIHECAEVYGEWLWTLLFINSKVELSTFVFVYK